MADSIRQQIIDKLAARLAAIKITGGYKTDIGSNVFDWLARDLADAELDAVIYRDVSADISMDTLELRSNKIRVEIEAKTKSGSTTAAQVREMIEDIYTAINVDDTWDALALNTEPVGEEMMIGHGDKITGFATITIEIEYRTTKWGY